MPNEEARRRRLEEAWLAELASATRGNLPPTSTTSRRSHMPDNDSPQVPPVGLATKLGLVAITLLGAAGAIAAFLDGDHTPETITLIAGAVATAISVIVGRSQQAAAIYGARALRGQALEPEREGT